MPDEYVTFSQGHELNRKNNLRSLTPFCDLEWEVIRVSGRLGQSPFAEAKKFPILKSNKSKLVLLHANLFYEAALHGGGQLTLNLLRQEYWIINGKLITNNFIKKCVTCFRFSTTLLHQLLADSPSERTTPSRPFSNCEIDLAGPISIKNDHDNRLKIYFALFVCIATEAVHIEMVSSLNESDCILSLKNSLLEEQSHPELRATRVQTFWVPEQL